MENKERRSDGPPLCTKLKHKCTILVQKNRAVSRRIPMQEHTSLRRVRRLRSLATGNVMAAMKYVVKYFAEITIKSKPVRR